jgi:YegS/Rv2252/BmrU family lipid kinase
MKWTIIRNPNASSGKGVTFWPRIREILLDSGIEFEDFRTDYCGHATELTRAAISKGSRFIAAMGGDGTVNEVANGILGQSYCDSKEILFTQIPIGTGNDWSRTMMISKKLNEICTHFKTGKERLQDVGLISWTENNKEQQRYFVNMAGMGFDAYVGKIANEKKAAGKAGIMGYVSTLLSCLFFYKAQPVSLKYDGVKIADYELFSLSVGICRFSGAGMLQCPNALYDDGLLDLTLIDKISKMKVLLNIPGLFSGKFVKNKEVHQFRAKHIEITASSKMLLEVDGEIIGSGSCEITILPAMLRVLGGLFH